MVKALFNAVIVKPIEEDESTYGNIVVPDMGKEKNSKCEVVSVGPGAYSVTGSTFIETTVKVGDIVLLPSAMGPTKVDYGRRRILHSDQENQILAIIEE